MVFHIKIERKKLANITECSQAAKKQKERRKS